MSITTLSSRAFNQDTSGAKRAASEGPVFITDRGQPTHVLLRIEEYRRLSGVRGPSLADMLAMPEGGDLDFEFPTLQGPITKPFEFD